MPHRNLKITALLLALVLTAPVAAHAQNAPQKAMTLGEISNRYDEIKKTLTPEQQAILENLDKEQTVLSEPQIKITVTNALYESCTKKNPGLPHTHGRMLQNFKLMKIDEYMANQKKLKALQDKIDFIDPYILGGHLQRNIVIQKQLVQGTAQIAAQIDSREDVDKCAELRRELETTSITPYAQISSRPVKISLSRDESGRLTSCFISAAHDTPKGMISTSIVLLSEEGKTNYDFSTKIYAGEEALKIEDTWMSLGAVDTRLSARMGAPGEQILIGNLPLEMIVPTLAYLKTGPFIASARAVGWDKNVTYETSKIPAAELDKFASCAAAMSPNLKEPLQKAGFTIAPDERHQTAQAQPAQPQDPNYKVMSMLDDPANPGACIWNFGSVKHGAQEIGGIMMVAGHIAENNPMNNKTVFWVLGTNTTAKEQSRLTFTDAAFSTKDPQSGKAISTQDFKPQIVSAQRYEIRMPFETYIPFVTGIQSSGLTMTAKAQNAAAPVEKTLPPPQPQSYKAYYDCVQALTKDLAKRKGG
jgi:hypothetical protein